MGIENYSTTPASNNSAAPNGFKEGMLPSDVNNSARQVMSDIRTWYESAEWINLGLTPTYISATSFSVPGDYTAQFLANRRIKISDSSTLYGYITSSSFAASKTTVVVELDSGSISASISQVDLNIISEPILSVLYERKIHSGDGSTTSFALDVVPVSENALIVTVNGVVQKPGTSYYVSGSNVVFYSAPPVGTNNIVVVDISAKAVVNVPADGSVVEDKLGSSSVTTAKIQDSNVTTAKIADNNVTLAKLAQVSSKKVLGNMGASTANASEVSVLDEDNMGSNSDVALITQQSAKAYVDNQIAANKGADYTSSEITVVSGSHIYTAVTHGLGAMPSKVEVSLVCKTAELGYSVGDEAQAGIFISTVGGGFYKKNSTEIQIIQHSNPGTYRADTGAQTGITASNWRYLIRAWK